VDLGHAPCVVSNDPVVPVLGNDKDACCPSGGRLAGVAREPVGLL
jgi:hypothetical protein